MAGIVKKIETKNGIYTVRIPSGRMGAIHFGIISKLVPTEVIDGKPVQSPGDIERMGTAFEEWATRVLPNIIVDGPFSFDDMPGSDQYMIYIAICESDTPAQDKEPFRILE